MNVGKEGCPIISNEISIAKCNTNENIINLVVVNNYICPIYDRIFENSSSFGVHIVKHKKEDNYHKVVNESRIAHNKKMYNCEK